MLGYKLGPGRLTPLLGGSAARGAFSRRCCRTMGIYDREYYRQGQPGFSIRKPQTIVVAVMVINAALWLLNGLLWPDPESGLTYWMAVHEDTLTRPWMWWQFLTYGFAHADAFSHVLMNMLVLFFLGQEIESHYGRREFLRLYLVLLVVGSVTWALLNLAAVGPVTLIGASGAVSGVVVLYALNFPRRTLLLFFVIPVPAWLVGVLVVASDVMGATGSAGMSNVAYSVHLAGAAFAFVYYQQKWNLTRVTEWLPSIGRLRSRPKLRIHHPQPEEKKQKLSGEVDRILEKIHREGEASLTRKERRTLESASRQYQQRRRPGDS